MQSLDFDEILDQITSKDARYHRDSYFFLREALDYTQKSVVKNSEGKQVRHVSGQELLGGIRDFALEQFGPMAITLLTEWGITRCEDFGEMVFNLVEARVLSKTEEDSRADFIGGYDFEVAFRQPFLPSRKLAPAPAPETHQA